MKRPIVFLSILSIFIFSCTSTHKVQVPSQAYTPLFEQYRTGKTSVPLPDFSWVGYHYGNDPLPIVKDYKIFDVTAFGAIPNLSLIHI